MARAIPTSSLRIGVFSFSEGVLLCIFLWFGSSIYLYLYSIGGPKPLYSYFVLVGLALSCFLSRVWRRGAVVSIRRELILFCSWLAMYFGYGLLGFVRSTQSEVALQALITLCETVLLGIAFLVLMTEEQRIRRVANGFVVLALFATAMNLWDFWVPTFSNVPGRSAGLYINPNTSGLLIALAMIAGSGALPARRRMVFVIACAIGVLITFSRSAWLAWGMGVVCLAWHANWGTARRHLGMVAFALTLGLGTTILLFSGKIGGYVADSPIAELLTPNTAARLGIGSSVISGDAANERLEVALVSLKESVERPWLGHGLGYTREWEHSETPHNMYLLSAVEGGLFGLALYLALLLVLWRAGVGVGRVMVLQLAVASLFSHNLLEQPPVVMMIAYIVAHGAVARRKDPTSKRYYNYHSRVSPA